jgi:hypothetical protein
MDEEKPNDTCEMQARLSCGPPMFARLETSGNEPAGIDVLDGFSALGVQKLIRAVHAKEKQLPEELVQPPESP